MKKRRWIMLGLLVVGGYVSYKAIYAVGLMLGVWHTTPVSARAKLVMDVYPLDEGLIQASEGQTQLPRSAPARIEQASGRPKAIQLQALKQAGGHAGKALDLLLRESQEPEGAQALFEAMRDLAPQGSGTAQAIGAVAKVPEGVEPGSIPTPKTSAPKPAPLFRIQEGEVGIAHVARVASALGERMKAPKVNPLDAILLEEAIYLMGLHGAPQRTHAVKAVAVGETQAREIAPIDPVVKGTLRLFFKSGEPSLSALAARSLGRLGDAETAEDLINNPKAYPGGSIADFGPEQVEKWKQNRLKLLRQGRGVDEASYWQGVRLTPKHMDTAIDLARAGDGGAGMAVERNMSIEAMQSTDSDGRMAHYLDIRLRFPGTREAWKAGAALGGDALTDILSSRCAVKTREAYLRVLDHDLKVVFSQTTTWRPENLVLDGWFSYLTCLNHHRFQSPAVWSMNEFESFNAQIEALFRKHYRKTIQYKQGDWQITGRMAGMASELSLYARHIGLSAIEYPDRKRDIRSRLDFDKGRIQKTPSDVLRWTKPRQDFECVAWGHIKSLEDF